MKLFNTKKKIAAAALAGLAVVGTGVGALAYWTSSGSGSGTGNTTAGASNLTYAQNTLTDMYPGDASQPLTVTVTNANAPGDESQYVSNVDAYVTTDKVGCDGSDFLLNGAPAPSTAGTAVPLTWTAVDLAAGASAATSGNTIQFNNKAAFNQNACKSAVVTLHYSTT